MGAGGVGIAHADDGKTVFVPLTAPDDLVDVEITSTEARFDRAQLVSVLSAGPARVAARCPHFGVCGGCDLQHIDYSQQLNIKRELVTDAIARIGGIADANAQVRECVPSRDWHYRNKIELACGTDSAGRLSVGLKRRGSDDIVPVSDCPLFQKLGKRTRPSGKQLIAATSGALRYLTGSRDLGLTRVQLRVSDVTGNVEVALWTTPGSFPRAMVARTLGSALPDATGIVRVLATGHGAARRIKGVEVLSGAGNWSEQVADERYRVSAPSFFQVNRAGAEVLVREVCDWLDPDGTDTVLDLYAGVGTFTLPLARLAGHVTAIEGAGTSIRDLRRNVEDARTRAAGGFAAVDIIGGDAAHELATLRTHIDAVVVDPPRSGLNRAGRDALIRLQARKIAYVSCNPATLARDLRGMLDSGYRLCGVTPVDMFAQTAHIECVARLERV
jgi:23S rRNA (uracil1939-C5)-methyltransferase